MAFPHRSGSGEFEEILGLNETTRQFIREHLNDDVPTLALKKAPVGTDLSLALRQIEARQLLRKKAPEWSANEELLFPHHLSIEQGSSEATAKYKSKLLKGKTFVDLTGGLGIDSYYLSQSFEQSDYVERQPELCELAKHNFKVLNASITVWNETAEEYLKHCAPVDCIYLDPARRDRHGRKTVAIGGCTPDVTALHELLLQKAPTVLVKLSPMLDITQALTALHHVKDIHILAVANECKELVFRLERGHSGPAILHCVPLQSSLSVLHFTQDEEQACPLRLADQIDAYLFEPNAALLKAGCFKLPAERFGVLKLHKNSHLYTSDQWIPDFPGRSFIVEGWALYSKKVRQNLLSDLSKANLAVRNFPLSVDELRKSLKINEGGETYLFATTLKNGEKVLIRTKYAAS